MRLVLQKFVTGGVIGFVIAVAASAVCAEQADLMLTHGKVYVGNDGKPVSDASFADTIIIKDGAIVFVGAADGAIGWQATDTIDLGGKVVLPGFVDGHAHAASSGMDSSKCALGDAPDLEAAKAIIRGCLAANPPKAGEWFEVILADFVGQTIPVSEWDSLRSDGPMIIRGSDYHTLYANSAAIKVAAIAPDAVAPAGGAIDLAQGFFADAAMAMVTNAMPVPTADALAADTKKGAIYGMRYMNAYGVTSMREAAAPEEQVAAYAQLAAEGKVTVRTEQSIVIDPLSDPKVEMARAAAIRDRFAGTPYMTVNSIKIFADGVIEAPAHTAALLEPYIDAETGKPGTNKGDLLFDPATIGAVLAEADRQNFDVHVHAIGDGAVHSMLDAFEVLRKTASPEARKLSIAHVQLITPTDFPRFAQLSVSANFQFYWALPESYTIEALLPYLGEEREQWLYPAGSLYAAGAPLSAGSDWNVTTPNPFAAIQQAILRTNFDERDGYTFDLANTAKPSAYMKQFGGRVFKALGPDQRLPLEVVLQAYTMGSARELRLDKEVGSITVGKRADLIVIDHDLFEVAQSSPYDISAIHVCRTYFEGKLVYTDQSSQDILGVEPSAACK